MFEPQYTIFTDKEYKDKADLMAQVAQLVSDNVTSSDDYEVAVKAREATFNTYIGYDVAIPHAKTDAVKTPFVVYVKVEKGLSWGDDGEIARHVFMIGVPMSAASNLHLKIISELSRNVIRSEWRERFMNAASQEEAYNILKVLEKEIVA